MVNFPQYYQYLYMFAQDAASTQDSSGHWARPPKSADGWQLVGMCREETNGKGNTVTTADGQVLVFASLIQLPVGTTRVNEGCTVIVTRTQPNEITDAYIAEGLQSGEVVAKGVCKKFDSGRLHCRLWI